MFVSDLSLDIIVSELEPSASRVRDRPQGTLGANRNREARTPFLVPNILGYMSPHVCALTSTLDRGQADFSPMEHDLRRTPCKLIRE